MWGRRLSLGVCLCATSAWLSGNGVQGVFAQGFDTNNAPRPAPANVAARLQPLGAPSMVDQFRSRSNSPSASVDSLRARDGNVRQTAYQWTTEEDRQALAQPTLNPQFNPPAMVNQQAGFTDPERPKRERSVLQVQNITLPPGNLDAIPQPAPSLPPAAPSVLPPSTNAFNNTNQLRSGVNSGGVMPPTSTTTIQPGIGQGNIQPIPQGTAPAYAQPGYYATVDNSPCVTAPVSYTMADPCGCGPFMQTSYETTIAPPALAPAPMVLPQGAPVTVMPTNYTTDDVGYRPLISLGQENYPVVLGRGIIGQPTAYVPGQCFRNFLRYISP